MILVALDLFFLQARAGRDINLAADDGLDAFRAGGLIKFDDAVHRAVVGDGQRGKFQFMRPLHQRVQAARTIEQRILGVQMQVDKISVRHQKRILRARRDAKQAADVHKEAFTRRIAARKVFDKRRRV